MPGCSSVYMHAYDTCCMPDCHCLVLSSKPLTELAIPHKVLRVCCLSVLLLLVCLGELLYLLCVVELRE